MMKHLVVGLVAAATLMGTRGAAIAADPVPIVQSVELPAAAVHPTWTRSCGFANCSVYFNKRETRIAAYGGGLLSTLICVMLRSTPAALFCTGIAWAVGKAGDNAVAAGRCVKISFSWWTGVPYYIGTYGPSWRCS